ncbi:class I SAM-dependent methyltransferase [Paenibacillus elgii]|uniref:class I SAM-dependent methyltransferase n=1 Tax=Paenibacillus elgii TaxID=189691 RepID=UPI000FD6496D|nr:class I SAM-dependent methyltransferase [Paenibacillus elgii]NEN86902.1 class I SAM-dependent methyltransferase [Paenibacillus elgii]
MNSIDYKQFYDKVGKTNGWDFSNVKCISEGIKWDFYSEVTKACKKSDLLLDIGTGGGEAILTIAEAALLLVGIDQSTGMIETATNNLANSGRANVRFLQMDAQELLFPENFFNIVSCRHSVFYAKEIAKVLVKEGIFLTQQVSENDKLNIKEAFGRGQALGITGGTLKHQCIAELSEAGFTHIQSFDCNVIEFYQTAEDLIFLLKHTPIIPNFGQSEFDFQILQQFIAENQTEKGIKTNSERFMIIARV